MKSVQIFALNVIIEKRAVIVAGIFFGLRGQIGNLTFMLTILGASSLAYLTVYLQASRVGSFFQGAV